MSLAQLLDEISKLDPADIPAVLAQAAARLAERKSEQASGADENIGAREAARILGVSKSHLYHCDWSFTVMVGNARRYSKAGIQRYIAKKQGLKA